MAIPARNVLLVGFEEWENLGLRSIAAYLREHGVGATILPLPASVERIVTAVAERGADVVGFSLIFQRMVDDFAELVAALRASGVTAHMTIGGHFASIEPVATLELMPGLDSVVCGEGEETLLDLVQRLDAPDTWDAVLGLAYRGADGEVRVNPPRPKIEDLDALPFAIRSDALPTHRGLGMCSIAGSRGCYYDCSFCSIQEFYARSPGPRRRTRSPGNVVDEIERLFHERGIRIFIFEDDDMFMRGAAQREWVGELAHELRDRHLADRILWRVSCRIDDIHGDTLRRMMDAGLMSVYIGIESGNDQGLATCNKHYSVADIHRALDVVREAGVPFEAGFMLLHPDTTFATLREDISFLREMAGEGQTVIQFTKMVPYAGTPISRRLIEEGRLRGTLAAPDYDYLDSRLGLQQLFYSQAFHDRNFSSKGLSEQLRFAKLDVAVVRRFFPELDAEAYAASLTELIRRSNVEALEKMSMAATFMSERTRDEIIDRWAYLAMLAQEERIADSGLQAELAALTRAYGLRVQAPRLAA